jgi:hypothetical protein
MKLLFDAGLIFVEMRMQSVSQTGMTLRAE